MFASTALTPAYVPFAGRRIVRWCPVETGLGVPGRDPDDVAPMFVWAATALDSEDLDGEVVDLRA